MAQKSAKGKKGGKGAVGVKANPLTERCNFMLQASWLTRNIANSSGKAGQPSSSNNKPHHSADKNLKKQNTLCELSRWYATLATQLRLKQRNNVKRPHVNTSRLLCRACGSWLVGGAGGVPQAKLRFRSKRYPHLVVTCDNCKRVKRYVVNPDYQGKCEQL